METQPSTSNHQRAKDPGGGFGRVIAGSLLASVAVGPVGFCAGVYFLGAWRSITMFVVSAVGTAIVGGVASLMIGRRIRGRKVDPVVIAAAAVGVLASGAAYFGFLFLLLAMRLLPQ